jgi:Uma2 family endonuclease
MTYAQPEYRFSAEDYLSWEAKQTDRHEYFQGEVFAMSGGTQNHNTVAINALFVLRQHLKGSPCKVFMADVRVLIKAQDKTEDIYLYPDVVVTCQPSDTQNGQALAVEKPILVLEVLSDSTASWDRGGKFAADRQLPSLQEYGLFDPLAGTVELFRRNAQGRFELFTWALANAQDPDCEFASVGLRCLVADLFDSVERPASPI